MRTIIDETVSLVAKQSLDKLGKRGTVAKKLQAVIAAHQHGIRKVSEVMNVSPTSVYLWAKQIKQGQLDSLINKSKHQGGIKLKKIHKEKIKDWLSESPNLTIREVKALLLEEFNIGVSKSTVHRAIKESGFSYITGRKQHYKQNKLAGENFKK